MKTRIIVAAIGIPLLLAVIFFLPLWAFAILAAAICAIAAWELIKCAAAEAGTRLRVYAMVSAAAIAMGAAFDFRDNMTYTAIFLLFLCVFCEIMLSFRQEEHISFRTAAVVFTAGVMIPLLLSALVRLGHAEEKRWAFLLLPFVVAFSSDSGAYFAGSFLGRHKLTPHLSPKKTVEGSIGGFVSTVALLMIYGAVLKKLGFEVSFVLLAAYGLLGSLVCQLGDLAFSAVKREFGIKDYGNLLPGHGGALDRFDSMVFVAPLVEVLMLWLPAFSFGG